MLPRRAEEEEAEGFEEGAGSPAVALAAIEAESEKEIVLEVEVEVEVVSSVPVAMGSVPASLGVSLENGSLAVGSPSPRATGAGPRESDVPLGGTDPAEAAGVTEGATAAAAVAVPCFSDAFASPIRLLCKGNFRCSLKPLIVCSEYSSWSVRRWK